jgi:hypothetical protein
MNCKKPWFGSWTKLEKICWIIHSFRVYFWHLPHPFRVWIVIFYARFECDLLSYTLVSSVVLRLLFPSFLNDCNEQKQNCAKSTNHKYTYHRMELLHSKRVKKIGNYTRNEWGRWETTLETSGEDTKLHSRRVGKMQNFTRNEWSSYLTTDINRSSARN